MRRFLNVSISNEYVRQWEMGLMGTALVIEREMYAHGMTEWPELMHARPESFGWVMTFAWAES